MKELGFTVLISFHMCWLHVTYKIAFFVLSDRTTVLAGITSTLTRNTISSIGSVVKCSSSGRLNCIYNLPSSPTTVLAFSFHFPRTFEGFVANLWRIHSRKYPFLFYIYWIVRVGLHFFLSLIVMFFCLFECRFYKFWAHAILDMLDFYD